VTKRPLRIGIIGTGFMGRVHSHAWRQVAAHFDLPVMPVLHTVCGRRREPAQELASRYGWHNVTTDTTALIHDPDIDLIDITAPNNLHADLAIAAAKAGKTVACEKPLACTGANADRMARAVDDAKVASFVWFNYRRVPALALVRHFVQSGRIGRIFRVQSAYLQDWLNDCDSSDSWRLQKDMAGGGSLIDLASHVVDLVRAITGCEFLRVAATMRAFKSCRAVVPQARTGDDVTDGKDALSPSRGQPECIDTCLPWGDGPVDVDDALAITADLSNGAICSIETSRCATGHGNDLAFEVNGDRGAIRFRLPEFNHLEFWDNTLPVVERGWRRITATGSAAPYASAYWPTDHALGYADSFTNTAADILRSLGTDESFSPNFDEGRACQHVLDAIAQSAAERRWVELSQRISLPVGH
jgi:predicted dehydrogenase